LRIERLVNAMLFENVGRDERQLVHGFTEFGAMLRAPMDTKQIPLMAAEIYRVRSDKQDFGNYTFSVASQSNKPLG
jgi:hypothetical protein